MKQFCFIFQFFVLLQFLGAQQKPTFEMAKQEYVSAEQALGLPIGYEVVSCEILLSRKKELFKVYFSKCQPIGCLNTEQSNFAALWNRMYKLAYKGDKLIIGEIQVSKGVRKIKMVEKTFLVP